MFGLPNSTEIRKQISKKLLYQKFSDELKGDKKRRFEDDISKIVIIGEISKQSIHIRPTDEVSSIFVVQIDLKSKEYNDRNVILISKLFKQNLLLILHFEDEYQLAIYETRLLKSEWKSEEEINISIQGLDFSSVWENLVSQVSGINAKDDNTLQEQINIEAEKDKLLKQVDRLEKKARKEPQSKKKFELFEQVKEYRKKLRLHQFVWVSSSLGYTPSACSA